MLKFYKIVDETEDEVCTLSPVDKAYLDGYDVGDRLLEGLKFILKVSESGEDIDVSIGSEDEGFFQGLNEKYWLNKVKKSTLEWDLFESKEGEEIILWNNSKTYDKQCAYFSKSPIFKE